MAPEYQLRNDVDRLVTAGIVVAGDDTIEIDAEEAVQHDELVRADADSEGSDSDGDNGDGDGGGS